MCLTWLFYIDLYKRRNLKEEEALMLFCKIPILNNDMHWHRPFLYYEARFHTHVIMKEIKDDIRVLSIGLWKTNFQTDVEKECWSFYFWSGYYTLALKEKYFWNCMRLIFIPLWKTIILFIHAHIVSIYCSHSTSNYPSNISERCYIQIRFKRET